MGLLGFLFGRRLSPSSGGHVDDVELDGDFVTSRALDWFGPFNRSPNGRWIVSWLDAGPHGANGRLSGTGGYLLYDTQTGEALVRDALERPNNGHVANNGVFVLEDWHFTDDLLGTLYVFDTSGNRLFERTFSANLLANTISENGRYVLAQLANSTTSEGSKLFLFELDSGRQLYEVLPSANWTMDYSIDEERGEAIAHVRDLGDFRYSVSGQFLDGAAHEDACLRKGDYGTVIRGAETILQDPAASPARLRKVLAALDRARCEGADADASWKASAIKAQGMTYEALGDVDRAINAYEHALSINPKIGVKRRLAALRKNH
jgi:tetratricopeptide (TPR) repeat protein